MTEFTPDHFQEMQQFFSSGTASEYEFRKKQLQVLKKGVQQYEERIMEALYKDLHKSKEEAFTTEIGFVYAEINHAISNLKNWMQPLQVNTPLVLLPSTSYIHRDPLGVCLIIAPWNYPFQLLIAPLIGAIAGGNCAVLKPSEITAHTSKIIVEMIAEFFDKKYIIVVEGEGSLVVPQLMNENRFDHVFFTGSITVGRQIAILAAEKLIPVVLELGGKSPCVVDESADIKVAAKRITWGKFTNAGQTCVAPDYLLVQEKIKDELIGEMQKSIRHFYGVDPFHSQDYGRIVSESRFEKLESFLSQGNIITGGKAIKKELYISPTLMDNAAMDSTMMNEEIFGPVLPIISYKKQDEALEIIKRNPNPLSLYYFGNNQANEKLFIDSVHFGGGCINNTLMHLGNPDLPFGGVGNSGSGVYHGRFSFETFTRAKAILKTATWIDPAVKYPPYKGKMKFLRWFFK